MRIAVFTDAFPLPSQTFVRREVEGLRDRGHEVAVFSRPWAGEEPPEPVAGVAQFEWPDLATGRRPRLERELGDAARAAGSAQAWRAWWRAHSRRRFGKWRVDGAVLCSCAGRWREERFEPDVCYAHFGPNGLMAAELRALGVLQAPVATVYHAMDLSWYLAIKPEGYYKVLFEEGARHLPVSGYWAERLQSMGVPPERIEVHHMGVKVGAARVPDFPEPGEPLRLVSVARLVEKKGLALAVEALGRAKAAGRLARSVDYHIIGEGPERAAIEAAIARHGLADTVRLLGWQQPDAVQASLEAAHGLVAPSLTAENGDVEGIPVGIMEGMAMGLPVLSTRHTGIPELVEHGVSGWLSEEKDVAGLQENLERICAADKTELERVSRAAYAKVEADFNLPRRLAALERMLQQVAQS